MKEYTTVSLKRQLIDITKEIANQWDLMDSIEMTRLTQSAQMELIRDLNTLAVSVRTELNSRG